MLSGLGGDSGVTRCALGMSISTAFGGKVAGGRRVALTAQPGSLKKTKQNPVLDCHS